MCVKWIHYCLVMKNISHPLSEHTSPEEPLLAVFYTIYGHNFAWTLVGVLYRNVSNHNIVIYDDPDNPTVLLKGLLINWDLVKL
ncbi:hypothetical protein ABKN59_011592 [Abortiporus biennis]